MNLSKEPEPSIMDELYESEERIIREIEQTEKEMRSKDLREESDRFMPKIDTLNWVLNEILRLERAV
ncbi:MAG: hypothetical protein WB988_18315 [Candidatus Nitrosopolaris sp.]|jgi:hypothetical protein